MTDIKPQDIEALLETFDDSEWEELRLKIDGLEVYLSKKPGPRLHATSPHHAADSPPFAPMHATAQSAEPHALVPISSQAKAKPVSADAPDHWVAVRAPNLGTFYRAPKPGAAPYVSVGQRVDVETEVCLIEVMKLFTSVLAGVAGTVGKVLVEDAELVEYDQPLFLVEPDEGVAQ
jgi:acetyl-CoA carboxylase biotin carboxyl carrier protein